MHLFNMDFAKRPCHKAVKSSIGETSTVRKVG